MKIRASLLGIALLSGCVGVAPPPPNATGAVVDLADAVDADGASRERQRDSWMPGLGNTPRPCMPGPTEDIAGPVPCPPGPTGDGSGDHTLH